MIALMYAGNAGVFDGIFISLLSASKYASEPLDVYLMTMDLRERDPRFCPLSETQRNRLERLCREQSPQSRVTLLDIGPLYRERLWNSPNAETGYTPYCFLRLFADQLPLPDRVLYLDADTVINGDLLPLYQTDLADCEYGAVLDYYGRWFMGYHYINSGVMLLNLPQLRRTGLLARAVTLCAERRLFLPDQTALHRLTWRKRLLPRRYNEQKDYRRPDTVIQHFTKTILWLPYFHTRNIKPWETERVHAVLTDRYDGLLQDYRARKREWEEHI